MSKHTNPAANNTHKCSCCENTSDDLGRFRVPVVRSHWLGKPLEKLTRDDFEDLLICDPCADAKNITTDVAIALYYAIRYARGTDVIKAEKQETRRGNGNNQRRQGNGNNQRRQGNGNQRRQGNGNQRRQGNGNKRKPRGNGNRGNGQRNRGNGHDVNGRTSTGQELDGLMNKSADRLHDLDRPRTGEPRDIQRDDIDPAPTPEQLAEMMNNLGKDAVQA